MAEFIVIHTHNEGLTVYPIESDFDIIDTMNGEIEAEDWPLFLAKLIGLNYEPWKNENLEIVSLDSQRIYVEKEDYDRALHEFHKEQREEEKSAE